MQKKRDEAYADRLFGLVLWNEYLTGQSEESLRILARKAGIHFPFEQTEQCYLIISGMERCAYREYGISAIHYDEGMNLLWESVLHARLDAMGYQASYIMEIYHEYKHLFYLLSPARNRPCVPIEQAADWIHNQLQASFQMDFLPSGTLHGNFTVYSDLLHRQKEIMNAFQSLRQLHGFTYFSPSRRIYAASELKRLQILENEGNLIQSIRDLTNAVSQQNEVLALQILQGTISDAIRKSMDRTLCLQAAHMIQNSIIELCDVFSIDSSSARSLTPENFSLFQPLMDALVTIVREVIDQLRKTAQQYSLLTRTAVLYIQKHFTDPDLSMQAIAEYAGVSPAYLSRTFNKEVRMSIPTYMLLQRIQLACQKLKQSDAPISEITKQCGFSDASYFCRQFKKQLNMSPSEYRTHA